MPEEKRKIKDSIAEKTKERWQGKRMHGQLPRNLDENLVDIGQSYRWLKSGDIKGETESTIVQLKTKQLVQTILRMKFGREKLRVNVGYVNNMKKLLSTYPRDAPFWQRTNI